VQDELLVASVVRVLLTVPWPAAVRSGLSVFWLGAGRRPQREQHELLVALAVRGLLLAPWPAAVRSGRTVLARHRPRPVT